MAAAGEVRCLTDVEVMAAIQRMERTGEAFDTIVSRMIFGGEPPKHRWPADAWKAWNRAVRLYDEIVLDNKHAAEPVSVPDLADSWKAFEVAALAVVGPRDEWWLVPGLEWRDIAHALGARGSRAITYRYRQLGWAFGGSYKKRRIVRAPCGTCAAVTAAPSIQARVGPCCTARTNGRRRRH